MSAFDAHAILERAYHDCITGRTDAARAGTAAVRGGLDISRHPANAVEIFLIEGIVHVYEGDIRSGVDRLQRACALGLAIGEGEAVALAKAWLSVVRFNDGQILEAAGLIAEAVRTTSRATERLRLRLGIMAAVLCRYCGLRGPSDKWFLVARLAAAKMHVSGALSSLIFDLAVTEIDLCQLEKLEGRLDPSMAEAVHRQVCSAVGYDVGAASGAQNVLHLLALGMSFNLRQRFGEAKDHLTAFLAAPQMSRDADVACGIAELATAELGLADGPLRQDLASRLAGCERLVVEPLERAIVLAAMAENDRRSGLLTNAAEAEAKKLDELAHRRRMSSLLEARLRELQLLSPPEPWVQ